MLIIVKRVRRTLNNCFCFLRKSVKIFVKTLGPKLKPIQERKNTPFPGKETCQDLSTVTEASNDDTYISTLTGNLKDDAVYDEPVPEKNAGLIRDDPEMDFAVNTAALANRGSVHMMFCHVCPCDILVVWFAKDFAFGKMAWIKPLKEFI